MLEKIGKTFVFGDEECKSADSALEKSVNEFYSALLHFGQDVDYQILVEVKGITFVVSLI
jgi:hypothetical protein